MKKPILLLASVALLIASCDKKERNMPDTQSTGQTIPVAVIEDTTYIINGLTNKNISSVGGNVSQLELVYQNGNQERIELSASNLPEGMKIVFEPQSGYPSFNTTMRIESSLTTPGTYPIKIHGLSSSGMLKTQTIDVSIENNYHCDSLLLNNIEPFYTKNEPRGDTVLSNTYIQSYIDLNTSPHLQYFLDNVYLETISYKKVLVRSFAGPSESNRLKFWYNCADHTIIIPEIILSGFIVSVGYKKYRVSGSGIVDFKKKTVTINYQVNTPENANWNYKMVANLRLY